MSSDAHRISVRAALTAAVPLLLVGITIAAAIAAIANDVYAFVKPDAEAVLMLNAPTDKSQICHALQELGVIKNDFAFSLYVSSKQKTEQLESLTGKWTLNSNMSYREILRELTK